MTNKLNRTARNKDYYKKQFLVTAKNKAKKLAKRKV